MITPSHRPLTVSLIVFLTLSFSTTALAAEQSHPFSELNANGDLDIGSNRVVGVDVLGGPDPFGADDDIEVAGDIVMNDYSLLETNTVGTGTENIQFDSNGNSETRIRAGDDVVIDESNLDLEDHNLENAGTIYWGGDGYATGGGWGLGLIGTFTSNDAFVIYAEDHIEMKGPIGKVLGDTLRYAADINMQGNAIENVGSCSGCDLAENIDAASPRLENGTLVGLDEDQPNTVEATDQRYDTSIVGAVSTDPVITMGGNNRGVTLGDDTTVKNMSDGETEVPVALTGVVPVRVTDANGDIDIGDEIAASEVSGVGMKARSTDDAYRPSSVIGKAMEPLEDGDGTINVLVR